MSFEDWFPYEEEAKSGEDLASLVALSPTPLLRWDQEKVDISNFKRLTIKFN